MGNTPTKATREQRETKPEQYVKHQNNGPDSDREGEGDPGVIGARSIRTESETEQPCPEEIRPGPSLTPDTDKQTLRR